ncbi:MAG: chorismate mutase [Terriglobales bacterium]
MEIADWRVRIDALDRQLAELLQQRCRCALEIGVLKRGGGLPVTESDREAQVLANAMHTAPGPLSPDRLRRIFSVIIEQMRAAQRY